MSSGETKKWIEAARVLGVDPQARVRCPARDDGDLTILDVPYDADPSRFERYLTCPTCGARNIMLMRTTVA
jgi:hypothetical protein